MQEGIAQEAQVVRFCVAQSGLLDHEPAGRIAGGHLQGVLVGDDTDEEQHQGRSHQVQRRTADGLVRPQIYGGKAQQQGENGAEYGRHQHSQQLKALQSHPVAGSLGRVVDMVGLHDVHEQHADKRT